MGGDNFLQRALQLKGVAVDPAKSSADRLLGYSCAP
jgi:hypothetical protein